MKKTPKEFIKYCAVGVINTLVGISTAFLCLNIFKTSYSFGAGAAYVTGAITSFLLNKKFTFKNNSPIFVQFLKFFGSMLPIYFISYALGYFLGDKLYQIGFIADILKFAGNFTNTSLPVIRNDFAVLISMVIYLVAGFSVNKFFVFTKK